MRIAAERSAAAGPLRSARVSQRTEHGTNAVAVTSGSGPT